MSLPYIIKPAAELTDWARDSRRRTLELIADLDDGQLLGPRLDIVNPLLWEIGHVAWFQEKWVLRHAGRRPPLRADGDALYDSAAVAHDTRWDLPLPHRAETLAYMAEVQGQVLALLDKRDPTPEETYFVLLSVFHEDMHDEAFTMTRQVLGYPPPPFTPASVPPPDAGPLLGDVVCPGGAFLLGASPEDGFAFDNEKWAHEVRLGPFAIARAPVTQAEFAAFVEDGGYERSEWWSEEGWQWHQSQQGVHPICWRRAAGGSWLRRDFDRWLPLEPHRPVSLINWYEAEAYCRWAGRRLPAEAEWEAAASLPDTPKRRCPWGAGPPDAEHANLDGRSAGCIDVAALPAGDSGVGCRQMLGNVWEWTASTFGPFPGFEADPYREYSAPWFGTHKVLRGGSWVTRGRMLRNTWRNFYRPQRRDAFAGFRTCALHL